MIKKKFSISAKVEGNKGFIQIIGEISHYRNHSEGFARELKEISDAGISDLEIDMNCPGGDCFEANQIVNDLKDFKGYRKCTLGALCASAATYVAVSCNHVKAARNTSYMIHKPWTMLVGNAAEIEAGTKGLKNLQKEYAQAYADKTGMSVEEIEKLWVEDYWMDAEEAKKLGFIDEIDGEVEITEDEITALAAKGYKNMPVIKATLKTEEQTIPTMKKIIAILASFPGVIIAESANESEVATFVDQLRIKALAHDDIKKKYDDVVAKALTDKIDAELKTHGDAKKFLPAAREFWKDALTNNFEQAKATLDAMPAVAKLSDKPAGTGNGTPGEDRTKWTWEDYQEKDFMALARMADEDADKHEALFNARKK